MIITWSNNIIAKGVTAVLHSLKHCLTITRVVKNIITKITWAKHITWSIWNHLIKHKNFLDKYIAINYSICIYPTSYVYLANMQAAYGDPRACWHKTVPCDTHRIGHIRSFHAWVTHGFVFSFTSRNMYDRTCVVLPPTR